MPGCAVQSTRNLRRHPMVELLAPAGDLPSFFAALKCGADAVYLGARSFGARSSVGFSQEDLATALKEAHLRGKRVYVTVNTLVKEHEFEDLKGLLNDLDKARVDAVLVQDLGVLHYIKTNLPDLPVHASTQMSIHNAAGAQFLMAQGVRRTVLARECSLETIKQVVSTGIETEVFVHGALCISVSGQCQLSSQIGGRSGNRGRCAQPCRLSYRYRGKAGAWLSPRDLNLLEDIPQLVSAGVCSFKIEGRLKRPEYVAVVTGAYRRAIDAALNEQTNDHLQEDQHSLLQIFNRGGFTKGPAFGRQDAQLVNPLSVSHEGLPIGMIKGCQRKGSIYLSEVLLSDTLHDGDNLQIHDPEADQEMIYSGPEILAGVIATIRHYAVSHPGSPVSRLVDGNQMRQTQAHLAQRLPPIPLGARLQAKAGMPLSLTLWDGKVETTTLGDIPTTAQSQPMTKENSCKAVQKTGESPFSIDDCSFHCDSPLFVPISALNGLRRNALEAMQSARLQAYARPGSPARSGYNRIMASDQVEDAALYVHSADIVQLGKLIEARADHFVYAPQDYSAATLSDDCRRLRRHDYFCLPPQASDSTLKMLHALVCELDLQVMLDNVGQLALNWPRAMLAGPGIPVWNRQSAALLADCGCQGMVCSRESSRDEIRDMGVAALPFILPVYGRASAMLLNHCPERTFRGLGGDKRACTLCAAGEGTQGRQLTDHLGAAFPLCHLRLPEGCLNVLIHHTPLHLSKRAIGKRWLLTFSTEAPDDAVRITRYYASLLRGENGVQALDIPLYLGRYDQGVQ